MSDGAPIDVEALHQELMRTRARIGDLSEQVRELRQREAGLKQLLLLGQRIFNLEVPAEDLDDERAGDVLRQGRNELVHQGIVYPSSEALRTSLLQQIRRSTIPTTAVSLVPATMEADALPLVTSTTLTLSTKDAVMKALQGAADDGLSIEQLEVEMRELGWSTESAKPTAIVRTTVNRLAHEYPQLVRRVSRGRYAWSNGYISGGTEPAAQEAAAD